MYKSLLSLLTLISLSYSQFSFGYALHATCGREPVFYTLLVNDAITSVTLSVNTDYPILFWKIDLPCRKKGSEGEFLCSSEHSAYSFERKNDGKMFLTTSGIHGDIYNCYEMH